MVADASSTPRSVFGQAPFPKQQQLPFRLGCSLETCIGPLPSTPPTPLHTAGAGDAAPAPPQPCLKQGFPLMISLCSCLPHPRHLGLIEARTAPPGHEGSPPGALGEMLFFLQL